jgi:multicomponent Na+:H+ antiporter subunit D
MPEMPDASPWIIWIIMMPLLAATVSFVVAGQVGTLLAPITAAGVGLSLVGLTRQILRAGPVRYSLGGWGAPLGIELYADGLSVFMLIMTAVVGGGITLYGLAYFSSGQATVSEVQGGNRVSASFWPLWLFAWGALNALFLSGDIFFNVYVTLGDFQKT